MPPTPALPGHISYYDGPRLPAGTVTRTEYVLLSFPNDGRGVHRDATRAAPPASELDLSEDEWGSCNTIGVLLRHRETREIFDRLQREREQELARTRTRSRSRSRSRAARSGVDAAPPNAAPRGE